MMKGKIGLKRKKKYVRDFNLEHVVHNTMCVQALIILYIVYMGNICLHYGL